MGETPGGSHTTAAALAYPLGALSGVVCLWRYREDAFVRFHAWQSILFSIAATVAIIALEFVPLLGLGLALVVAAGAVLLALGLMWRAYRGYWAMLPLLGDIALERASAPGSS